MTTVTLEKTKEEEEEEVRPKVQLEPRERAEVKVEVASIEEKAKAMYTIKTVRVETVHGKMVSKERVEVEAEAKERLE